MSKYLLRLTGLFPLAFAIFFAATTWNMFREVLHPEFPEMRLMAFGVGMLQLVGFLCTALLTLLLFSGVLWEEELL